VIQYSGLQNTIARESVENDARRRLYSNTPAGRFTRQMHRHLDRCEVKAARRAAKTAFKGKGGSAAILWE